MSRELTFDGVPVLSRGRHRSPRKGACFMEMASYLAGEKWSDHPSCTHPLLAQLARMVNDHTSDAERSALAPLIPSVVGVGGGLRSGSEAEVRWAVGFVVAVAAHTLREIPEATQRAVATGLIRCEQLAATLSEPVPGIEELRAVLADVPRAESWARAFSVDRRISHKAFVRHAAPSMVSCAVDGTVAHASNAADARLRDLLEVGIEAALRLDDDLAPPTRVEAPSGALLGSRHGEAEAGSREAALEGAAGRTS
ncbi:hypothetical protein [uncultured Nocardioides sp.]|uniref:hypothetical protein n=1 Tax=uncultured Nocardioides sp. TaxID=198441 RepID=UPI00263779BB|nr:hypothetical protein [uncultured Nocardioides sp.]